MIAKNYIELPTEGLVRGSMLDEGNAVTVYLDIRDEERPSMSGNPESGVSETERVKVGYAVRCLKPFSEERAVNAAVQTAFGLRDEADLSRYNADMAMKMADGSDDAEVKEYKTFVKWVRLELAKAMGGMDALETAKAQMLLEIDAYDQSAEVNGFYLNGQKVWLDFELRDRVYQGNERLQRIGRTGTTLWLGNQCYNLSIEQAQNIISHIEAYAKDCYNVTAQHKAAVEKIQTVEEVLAYDYKKGYPEQLKMEV